MKERRVIDSNQPFKHAVTFAVTVYRARIPFSISPYFQL